jgi:hypothetical protein
MGLAVPSVAEASRGLPSVKAFSSSADGEIVTSVAFSADPVPEQVSPELALVDPVLAAQLRALLPNAPDALAPRPARVRRTVAEPAPALSETRERAPILTDDRDPAAPVATPPVAVPLASNVHLLRPPVVDVPPEPAPAATSQPRPRVEIETPVAPEVAVRAAAPVAVEPAAARARAISGRRQEPAGVGRMVKAFVAGGLVTSFVVVGVIAALGESNGDPVAVGESPSLAPPTPVTPVPKASTASPSSGGAATKPSAKGGASGAAKKSASGAKQKPAVKAKQKTTASQTASRAKKKATTTKKPSPTAKKPGATAAAAPARRFAWAPVDGAVGYRVELFRGNEQVLRTTTKQPVYELPASWRHQGRAERLSRGSYRWYVWPVLESGPSAQAVVQARLDVP